MKVICKRDREQVQMKRALNQIDLYTCVKEHFVGQMTLPSVTQTDEWRNSPLWIHKKKRLLQQTNQTHLQF